MWGGLGQHLLSGILYYFLKGLFRCEISLLKYQLILWDPENLDDWGWKGTDLESHWRQQVELSDCLPAWTRGIEVIGSYGGHYWRKLPSFIAWGQWNRRCVIDSIALHRGHRELTYIFWIANCSPTGRAPGRAPCRDFQKKILIFSDVLMFQTLAIQSVEAVASKGAVLGLSSFSDL